MAAELNTFFAGLVISSFVCPLMGNLGKSCRNVQEGYGGVMEKQ